MFAGISAGFEILRNRMVRGGGKCKGTTTEGHCN